MASSPGSRKVLATISITSFEPLPIISVPSGTPELLGKLAPELEAASVGIKVDA